MKPESVCDVELGAEWRTKNLSSRLNLYDMEFRDEIAATGELSPIGQPLRRNVDRSFRRGIELEASWQALEALRLSAAVEREPEPDLVVDAVLRRVRRERRLRGLDEPDVPRRRACRDAALPRDARRRDDGAPGRLRHDRRDGRYVAASWLDNTNTEGLEAPRTFQLDATVVVDLARWIPAGKPRLKVQVNNVLDNRRLCPRGYSYLYANRDAAGAEALAGIPYYYPLATPQRVRLARSRLLMAARRIVVTGGECTGKTTLAEGARRALGDGLGRRSGARNRARAPRRPRARGRARDRADAHAASRTTAFRAAEDAGRPLVVFDQDLLSTVVYARHYYGSCPPWIERLAAERLGDLYLLCHPDLPWTADGVRDRPEAREEIHALFAAALARAGARVADVTGDGAEREARAAVARWRTLLARALRTVSAAYAEKRQQERPEEGLRPEDEEQDARDHPAHRLRVGEAVEAGAGPEDHDAAHENAAPRRGTPLPRGGPSRA